MLTQMLLWLAIGALARPIGTDPHLVTRGDPIDLGIGNHPVPARVDDVILLSRNTGGNGFEAATYDLDMVELSAPVGFGTAYEKGGSEVVALPSGDFLVGAPAHDTLRLYEVRPDGGVAATCDVGTATGARLPTLAIHESGVGALLWRAADLQGDERYWLASFEASDPCASVDAFELDDRVTNSPPSLVSTDDGFLAGLGFTFHGKALVVAATYDTDLDLLDWRRLGNGHRPEIVDTPARAMTVRRTGVMRFEVQRGKRTALAPLSAGDVVSIVHPLDRHFLVVWDDHSAVWGRIFDADGAPTQEPVLLSGTLGGVQRRPRIVEIAPGEAWVFWELATTAPFRVKGRRIRF